MYCVVTIFTPSDSESNKSKCLPALPGAWVPANDGTNVGPLCLVDYWMQACLVHIVFIETTYVSSGLTIDRCRRSWGTTRLC